MVFVFFWLSSLSMRVSNSIHAAANGILLFFCMAKKYSIVYIYHIFLIHSSVAGHLGYVLCMREVKFSIKLNEVGISGTDELTRFERNRRWKFQGGLPLSSQTCEYLRLLRVPLCIIKSEFLWARVRFIKEQNSMKYC